MKVELLVRVQRLLSYDADTGVLTWLESRGKAKAGSVAGCADGRGYTVLSIDGKRHYAHRIAMLVATGVDPVHCIDHINGNKGDNRRVNLREVSHAINQQNQRTPSRNNRLGVLGVRRLRARFRATICVNSSPKHIGTFDTMEEAHSAYLAAKRAQHEGCTI